ncbi:general substrate transporter [Phaeosphaeria sp. MPI-PUGE-AT-0046c]|nr:general substrate transporter [Phaeosphaeria sp. MPI-PUGE-AT-0046c]
MASSQAGNANEGVFKKMRSCFNGRLTYAVFIIALSQVNFGLEQAVFNSTQAMNSFTKKFGVYNPKKKSYQLETYYLSLLSSLTYIGFAFGLVTGNILSARIGRKKCFDVMCIYAIIGTLICITTRTNKWQMVVGRIVAYVYIGMELALVPVTQTELVPAPSTLNLTVEKGKFMELFQGTNLERTLIVIGVNVFLQLTGQNFSSVYGTIFIKSIGIVNPFTMNAITTACSITFVLLSQVLTDRTGRVPLMVVGALVQCGGLFTMGGLGTIANPSYSEKAGIVAMVTEFSSGFAIGWAPLSHVVAAEIPTQHLRDMTYAVGSVFNIAIQFAVSLSFPFLLNEPYAALGSKVGFIFGTTAFMAVIFSLFGIPECKGKSLEEIDELFLEGVPIRKFRTATSRHHLEVFEDMKDKADVRIETRQADRV